MSFVCERKGAICFFFFSSRRRHTRFKCDWSSDVCSSDLAAVRAQLDEQAVTQSRQRRAYRAAADPEQLGEIALHELGTRREAVIEDRVQDRVEDPVLGRAPAAWFHRAHLHRARTEMSTSRSRFC